MKTLTNHLLLFDEECPICDAYSRALVKNGMIDRDGRKSYQQELDGGACPMVDRQRAVNEIALVNLETGEVSYGIESVLKLYAGQYPVLNKVLAIAPLMWVLKKLYAFISYNRRVVIPVKQRYAMQSQLKLHYRIIYLLLTWLLTAVLLTEYAGLITELVPIGGKYREYAICGGQIFFQGIVACFVAKGKVWEYLGNMMTISFGGALLLGVMLIATHWIGNAPALYIGYFLTVAGLMFFEHIRRTKLLKIGWGLTITWVLYRLAVLVLILI